MFSYSSNLYKSHCDGTTNHEVLCSKILKSCYRLHDLAPKTGVYPVKYLKISPPEVISGEYQYSGEAVQNHKI